MRRILTPSIRPLRAYSGQAVDLQEATSEQGIRVAEYYLVINQQQLFYGRQKTESASRSGRGSREKTPLIFSDDERA